MIALKTWREIRFMALIYLLILELMLIPAILLWPELYPDLQRSNLLSSLPGFLRRMADAMRVDDAGAAFRGYMAVQMFFKGINVAGISCAVLLGTGMIARERENQSLEFLLARPLSRTRILWSKFWVTAAAVLVPIFVSSWSAIPLADYIGESLPFAEVTMGAFHSASFVLAFLALTCLLSVICNGQMQVAFVVGAVVIVQLSLFFIQSIRRVSAFRLSDFDVYGPILAGNVDFWPLFQDKTGWLLLATVILYVTADRLFRRTDL